MVSLGPCVEPFCPGWLLRLLPTERSCQVQACVCFPFASFQCLANPPSSPVTVAGLPKAKPQALYVISRLDLGQLEISWSRRWGDAVPAHARLQLPKLAGWLGAASLWLQSHAVPSPSTGTLGCGFIPFTPHPSPMRGEVSKKGTKGHPDPTPFRPGARPTAGLSVEQVCAEVAEHRLGMRGQPQLSSHHHLDLLGLVRVAGAGCSCVEPS